MYGTGQKYRSHRDTGYHSARFGDDHIGNVPHANPRRNADDIHWRSREVARLLSENYEGVGCTQFVDGDIEKLRVTYPTEALFVNTLLNKLIRLAQSRYGTRFTAIEHENLGQFVVVFT